MPAAQFSIEKLIDIIVETNRPTIIELRKHFIGTEDKASQKLLDGWVDHTDKSYVLNCETWKKVHTHVITNRRVPNEWIRVEYEENEDNAFTILVASAIVADNKKVHDYS